MRKRDLIQEAKWKYEEESDLLKTLQRNLRFSLRRIKNTIKRKREAKKRWKDLTK